MTASLPTGAEPASANAPYHKGNVPLRMMEAAERILATETVEDITARRLCREVGVTSANFYITIRASNSCFWRSPRKASRSASA